MNLDDPAEMNPRHYLCELARPAASGWQQVQHAANSGLAQIGTGAPGRFGAIQSGSLEQSNVSLADEFAKMIHAQRSFQANALSISVADQDFQLIVTPGNL